MNVPFNVPIFSQNPAPYRCRPAEYFKGYGWVQDGVHRRVKKPHYHFIWPKDGKNGTKWGRTKDILTGKGPDIHVTVSAEKMDYMANRQRKPTWAGHLNLDDRFDDHLSRLKAPWGRHQRTGLSYDFLTRKYRRPDINMLTDAIWYGDRGHKKFQYPAQFRDIKGRWWGHDPDAFDDFSDVDDEPLDFGGPFFL